MTTPTPEQLAWLGGEVDKLKARIATDQLRVSGLIDQRDFAEVKAIILSTFGAQPTERERIWRLAYSAACAGSADDYCLGLIQQLAEDDGVAILHLRQPAPQSQPAVTVSRSCPCRHGEPCFHGCTCVNPHSSQGCSFCCTYGSAEQQKVRAEHLRKLILLGIEAEKKAQPAVCVKCHHSKEYFRQVWGDAQKPFVCHFDYDPPDNHGCRCRCEFPQEGLTRVGENGYSPYYTSDPQEAPSGNDRADTQGGSVQHVTNSASSESATRIAEIRERRANLSTPPFEVVAGDNCGQYGAGPDTRQGFVSYAVVDNQGRTIVDTYNSAVTEVHEDVNEDGLQAWDEVGRNNSRFFVISSGEWETFYSLK